MTLNDYLNHIMSLLDLMKLLDEQTLYIYWFRGYLVIFVYPHEHPDLSLICRISSKQAKAGLSSREWDSIEGKIRELIKKEGDV